MTNPGPAANVNALAPVTNARGTSFSAALVQSVRSQTGATQTVPASFGVPGNTSGHASPAQAAGHAATAQTPPARLTSDAALSAKAGAKARPITAGNSMPSGKPGAIIAAPTAIPPICTTVPEQGRSDLIAGYTATMQLPPAQVRSDILALSAAQPSQPGASVDTSNTSSAFLAATLTPLDKGAAVTAMFPPAQGSIGMQDLKNPTATSASTVVASLSPAAVRSTPSPAVVSPGRLSATTAAFKPTAASTVTMKVGDATGALVSQPEFNGTVSSSSSSSSAAAAAVGSVNSALADLSPSSLAATNTDAADGVAEPGLTSADATGQIVSGKFNHDSAVRAIARHSASNDTTDGTEGLPVTGGASSAAPPDGNVASGGNELFSVINDNGGNGLPQGTTAAGDVPHLPAELVSPVSVLSPSDPAPSTSAVVIPSSSGPALGAPSKLTALPTSAVVIPSSSGPALGAPSKLTAPSTSAVVIPSSSGPALGAPSKLAALPETQAPLHSPLASGTGTYAAAKAQQDATTLTPDNTAAAGSATTQARGLASAISDRGRAAAEHETPHTPSPATGQDVPTRAQAASEFMSARNDEARTNLDSPSFDGNAASPRSASTGPGLATPEKSVQPAPASQSSTPQAESSPTTPASSSTTKTTATAQPAASPSAIAATLSSSLPAANAPNAAAAGSPLPAALPAAIATAPGASASSPPEPATQATPAAVPPHQMLDSAPLNAGAQASLASGVHSASEPGLLQMQVGIHTSAFGNVEVRTIIEHSQVGISIHGDHDVARWFSSEVGGLETGLNNQHLNLTAVDFSNTRSSIQTATSFQQGQPGQHLPQGRSYSAPSGGSTPADEPANESEISAAIPALGPETRVSILA